MEKEKVYKKEVKERHPLVKDDLADFVRRHPEILDAYKDLKGAKGPLDSDDLEYSFDELTFAIVLIEKLGSIDTGNAAASHYHSFTMGVLTFLLYPHLICPVKEKELHSGRKRVDIKYTNAAETGFFLRMLQSAQTRAQSVFVECKNYSEDINNPELDQLSGRFGHQRGFLGLLLCRRLENRTVAVSRCRDAANDGRGYMLVLEDQDIVEMLGLVRDNRRAEIDRFLQRRFDEITH